MLASLLYSKLSYDPNALVPVSVLTTGHLVLVARPNIPVATLQELVALAKANPGKLSYASPGAGTPPHLTGEMLKAAANIQTTHVPYKGLAPAVTDLLAGHVDIMFDNLGNSLAHIRDGRLKALAIASDKRMVELAGCAGYFRNIPRLSFVRLVRGCGSAKNARRDRGKNFRCDRRDPQAAGRREKTACPLLHSRWQFAVRNGGLPEAGERALESGRRRGRNQARMKADLEEMAIAFDDGLAYEHFMARWSRAAGTAFLDWMAPPKNARWLDVGCGTGAFSKLVIQRCDPLAIVGIDPSAAQIDYALTQLAARKVDFRVARAQSLPFPDHSFDIVAAALVVNFISDVQRALGEMHRVGRPGGIVAAYVWDFGAGRAPNSSVAIALRQIGSSVPPMPGTKYSSLDALRAKFWRAGLESIEVNSFEVTITFSDFEDFWRGQIPSFSPLARIVATLPECDRMRLRRQVRETMARRR